MVSNFFISVVVLANLVLMGVLLYEDERLCQIEQQQKESKQLIRRNERSNQLFRKAINEQIENHVSR